MTAALAKHHPSHLASEPRVQVIDMMTDQNDSEITKWIRRHNPNHPVLKDVGRKVCNQTGAQYIPTMVIIDSSGTVHYQHTGGLNRSAAHQVIDRLLTE
jgi:peroxiredoxin